MVNGVQLQEQICFLVGCRGEQPFAPTSLSVFGCQCMGQVQGPAGWDRPAHTGILWSKCWMYKGRHAGLPLREYLGVSAWGRRKTYPYGFLADEFFSGD